MLRLPDGMREALKEIAAANERSLNAEIVERLNGSLQWPLITISPAMHEMVMDMPVGIITELERRLNELVETEVSNAVLNHQLSQKNLLSRFDEFINYAPVEEQPRLRDEIRELLFKVGVYRQPRDVEDSGDK